MWPDAEPKAEQPRRSCACSSATSPARSSGSSPRRTQPQHQQPDRTRPSTPRQDAVHCGAGPGLPTPAHPGRRGSGVKRGHRPCAAIAQQPLTRRSGRTRWASSHPPAQVLTQHRSINGVTASPPTGTRRRTSTYQLRAQCRLLPRSDHASHRRGPRLKVCQPTALVQLMTARPECPVSWMCIGVQRPNWRCVGSEHE